MKYFKSYSTLIAITFIFILCLGTFCKLSSNLHDNPFTLETKSSTTTSSGGLKLAL